MKNNVSFVPALAKRRLTFSQWRSSSIVVDSTVKIFLVSISLALFFALASMLFIRDNETKRLTGQVSELLSTVESAVRVACFTGDKTLATDIAKGLLKNRLVAGVKISSDMQVLSDEKKAKDMHGNAKSDYVVQRQVSSPFSQNEFVGVIELTVDSDVIHKQAVAYSIMSSVILMLEVFTVAWAVVIVMLRTVVRPILTFSNQTHSIQILSGEHVEPPSGNSNNEIGQLANDFNQMIDQMSAMLAAEQVMRQALALNERHFRTLVENSPDIIARYDRDCQRVFVNPAYARETGTPIEQALNKSTDDISIWRPIMPREEYRKLLQQVMETGSPKHILLEWMRADNQWVSHEMYVVAEYDVEGQVAGTLAIGRDITQRKAVEQQLLHQASYDSLTGLPNRRMFSDRLYEELSKASRNGKNVALLFIDLDRFKEVNDTLGHNTGDRLLVEAAQRIRHCVRESDTVARLGGDEFVVILPEVEEASHLARIAQAIIVSMTKPFNFEDNSAYISASIGIASYPEDAKSQEALISCADQAMYAAKGLGRNGFSFFTQSMHEKAQKRLLLTNDIYNALSKDQLQVWMQPIIDVATGQIVKAEALLRWKHPQRGMVPPDLFIPVAEETGAIHEIGDWVFRQSAITAKHWLEMRAAYGFEELPCQISVNMSPRQFMRDNVGDSWIEYLNQAALPERSMVIEITEGLLLGDQVDITSKLSKFREMGIQVALDDFGTGYSAMAYLKKFNIDYLKIDQSFVRDLETDPNDRAIAEAIVVMAHKLGLKVIAEGVETSTQLALLTAVGCEYVQGYFYARPMPENEFLEFVRAKDMLLI